MTVIRRYVTGLLLLAGLIMAPLILQAQKPLRHEIEAVAESCIKSFFEADGYFVTGVRPFGILDESFLWLAELDSCGWIIISGDRILTFGTEFSGALDIASLDAGIYILEAWLRDGRVVRKKVIKN